MRKSCLIIFFTLSFLLSSTQNNKKAGSPDLIRKEAMEIAIKYARDKFKEAKETVARDGIVTIVESRVNLIISGAYQKKYVIDPARIKIGLIDDDTDEDAIVHISAINEMDLETPEHLILIKTNGIFILNRVIESNMKILGIKDRVITAEVSTRSLNSPLRDCSECKEVVKYKFQTGDLIRIDAK